MPAIFVYLLEKPGEPAVFCPCGMMHLESVTRPFEHRRTKCNTHLHPLACVGLITAVLQQAEVECGAVDGTSRLTCSNNMQM